MSLFGRKQCPCGALQAAQADIRKHEESLYNGNTKFSVVDMRLEEMEKDIKDIKKDVEKIGDKIDDLASKPAKKWDTWTDKVAWAIAGAVILFVLKSIGIF